MRSGTQEKELSPDMQRNMKLTIVVVSAAVLIAGCFGAYQLYQRTYLSSDLSRTLRAAMDSRTEADVDFYLRTARLQRRTKKDNDMVQDLDEAFFLVGNTGRIRISEEATNQDIAKALSLFNDVRAALQMPPMH